MSLTLLEFVIGFIAIVVAIKLGAILSPIFLQKLDSFKKKPDHGNDDER